MTIPEEVIADYLDQLVGHSQPGAVLHHLLVAATPSARTAVGLPDPAKLAVTLYAIDAADKHPLRMVDNVIRMAVAEAYTNDQDIQFAGLALEVHLADTGGDPAADDLARRLRADDRLQDHPAAFEATMMYAACRDGRRWTACRYVTGPRAGTTVGPDERVGALADDERHRQARLIRTIVGMP